MDEDWIKKVAAIARKVHLKSYAIHTLKRWLLGIRYKVAEVLEAQTLIGVCICSVCVCFDLFQIAYVGKRPQMSALLMQRSCPREKNRERPYVVACNFG